MSQKTVKKTVEVQETVTVCDRCGGDKGHRCAVCERDICSGCGFFYASFRGFDYYWGDSISPGITANIGVCDECLNKPARQFCEKAGSLSRLVGSGAP